MKNRYLVFIFTVGIVLFGGLFQLQVAQATSCDVGTGPCHKNCFQTLLSSTLTQSGSIQCAQATNNNIVQVCGTSPTDPFLTQQDDYQTHWPDGATACGASSDLAVDQCGSSITCDDGQPPATAPDVCLWATNQTQCIDPSTGYPATSGNGKIYTSVWCYDQTTGQEGVGCCDPATRPSDAPIDCTNNTPTPNCYTNQECNTGDTCSNATCQNPGSPNSYCSYTSNGTCGLPGSGYVCSNNACVFTATNPTYPDATSCISAGCGNNNPGSGFSCISNSCQPVTTGAVFSNITSCSASGCGVNTSGSAVANGVQNSCPANNSVFLNWIVSNMSNYTLFRVVTDGAGHDIGAPTVITAGIGSNGNFTDVTLQPGQYYRYFLSTPTVLNIVNTNNPGADFGGTCPGVPFPIQPTGGNTCNTDSAASCAGDTSPIACNAVRITWTDNATNETGYRLYIDDSAQPFATIVSANPANTGVLTYNYTLSDNKPHKYQVAVYNNSGQGARVDATNNTFPSTACTANIVNSDKDITAINGNAVPGVQSCDGKTDPLPLTTNLLQAGDVVSFQVNLCNNSAVTVSNVSLTDTLVNLQQPDNGWGMQYFDGTVWRAFSGPVSCPPSATNPPRYCVSGQQIQMNLTNSNFNILAHSVFNIRYNAKVTLPGSAAQYARFQNSLVFASTAGNQTLNTPLILFYSGTDVPNRGETKPQ